MATAAARPLGRPGGIGIVFQGPSLLPGFDVVENVALPMMLAGQDDEAADENARAALDLVGMSGAEAKLPDELSGGQSQRVAIARVLVTRALILADERLDSSTVNADRVVHCPPEHRDVDRSSPRALHPRPRRRRRLMTDGRCETATDVARRLAGFMIATWTLGLLRRRSGRMAATAIGVAPPCALCCLPGHLPIGRTDVHDRACCPHHRGRLAG